MFFGLYDPFHETSPGGRKFTMLYVNEFTRYKIAEFHREKIDTTEVLQDIINEDIGPETPLIGIVGADGEGESNGQIQTFLSEGGIVQDHPPHHPQYNGVVERAPRLLRDKTVALLRDVSEGKRDHP